VKKAVPKEIEPEKVDLKNVEPQEPVKVEPPEPTQSEVEPTLNPDLAPHFPLLVRRMDSRKQVKFSEKSESFNFNSMSAESRKEDKQDQIGGPFEEMKEPSLGAAILGKMNEQELDDHLLDEPREPVH